MSKSDAPLDPRDYEIRIWYSAVEGDDCFIAQVVEWPSIMAHGDTREKRRGKFSSPSKERSNSRSRKAFNLSRLH